MIATCIPHIWQDAECWIIGGGFSVIQQFDVPYQLYKQIAGGLEDLRAMSFYLEPIHRKHIIGLNLAGLLGPWVDILYFRDCDFHTNYYDRIKYDFSAAIRATSCTNEHIGSEVWCFPGKYQTGINTDPGQVNWNYDAGGAAINLAVQLGSKRIILVGFDMKPGPNGEPRWHGPHARKKGQPQPGQPFSKFLKGYGKIASDADKLGVQIINANPDSALDAFPKEPLETLL